MLQDKIHIRHTERPIIHSHILTTPTSRLETINQTNKLIAWKIASNFGNTVIFNKVKNEYKDFFKKYIPFQSTIQ